MHAAEKKATKKCLQHLIVFVLSLTTLISKLAMAARSSLSRGLSGVIHLHLPWPAAPRGERAGAAGASLGTRGC